MKKDKPLWEKQLEEIMQNTILPEPEVEEDDPSVALIRGIGLIITDMRDVLSPDQVISFMRKYHEEANNYAPNKKWRLFFEHMILELSQNYPVKETGILMFKAGQIFEHYRNELEGGDDA